MSFCLFRGGSAISDVGKMEWESDSKHKTMAKTRLSNLKFLVHAV